MISAWIKLGQVVGWLTWPAQWLYVRGSQRTRVLILAGDHLAVVKTWPGKNRWGLPGGGIHSSEPIKAASIREVAEETGLHLEPAQLSFLAQKERHETGLTYTCHFFVVKLAEQVPLKGRWPEISQTCWLPLTAVTNSNSQPDIPQALELYRATSEL